MSREYTNGQALSIHEYVTAHIWMHHGTGTANHRGVVAGKNSQKVSSLSNVAYRTCHIELCSRKTTLWTLIELPYRTLFSKDNSMKFHRVVFKCAIQNFQMCHTELSSVPYRTFKCAVQNFQMCRTELSNVPYRTFKCAVQNKCGIQNFHRVVFRELSQSSRGQFNTNFKKIHKSALSLFKIVNLDACRTSIEWPSFEIYPRVLGAHSTRNSNFFSQVSFVDI